MNINNRQQLLTIAAIAAVVLWVGMRMVVDPLTQSWKARAAQITQLENSVKHGSSVLAGERSIRDRWEGMRTNMLQAGESVAENQLLKAFDRWSQESQISIRSIKPQWKRGADDYMTLECRVDASGALSTITRFLYNIEADPLAIKVEAIDLTTRDNDGQQLTLGLQVSGLLLTPQEP